MAKIEELMENEEFVSKVEACETDEAVKQVYAEYGINAAENASEEISANQLEEVTGGVIFSAAAVVAAAPIAWKVGSSAGILMRAYYDYKRYGDPYRSYSKSQVDKLLKKLNLI